MHFLAIGRSVSRLHWFMTGRGLKVGICLSIDEITAHSQQAATAASERQNTGTSQACGGDKASNPPLKKLTHSNLLASLPPSSLPACFLPACLAERRPRPPQPSDLA